MPISDGAVFAGYTIVRLLGAGGMGEVYLVQHPRLPRREALKILPARMSADPEYRKRFELEADIAASLSHRNIVAVLNAGECDGQLWITMEYVEGTDAAQLVRDRYPHGMPPTDVIEIVSAIASALDYAHERHLLHRDVKPANILITDPRMGERRILLADFGIARDTHDIQGLTATNMAVGSIPYAAPEQLTTKTLDGRADQYALACTAFHLLTGQPPFVNSNPAVVIGDKLSSPPPRIGSFRADLSGIDNVLAKAMAREPFQRFDTCREFAMALAAGDAGWASSVADTKFATTIPGPARDSTTRGQAAQGNSVTISVSRRAVLIASVIAALLAVGVVAFIGARLAQQEPQPPTGSSPQSTSEWQESQQPPQATTTTKSSQLPATTTPPPAAPSTPPRTSTPPTQQRPVGDLGLTQPMSKPICDGRAIVVLGNVTTPGLYAAGVQQLLETHPGAFYLRTDQSCPSLRKADDEGDPIYTVFRPAGRDVCSAVRAARAAGDDAYAKWLDTTHDPGYIIPC